MLLFYPWGVEGCQKRNLQKLKWWHSSQFDNLSFAMHAWFVQFPQSVTPLQQQPIFSKIPQQDTVYLTLEGKIWGCLLWGSSLFHVPFLSMQCYK